MAGRRHDPSITRTHEAQAGPEGDQPMPLSSKLRVRIGIGLALAVVLGIGGVLAIRAWVVPALLVGRLQAAIVGKVTIRDWWIGSRSAGVVGLTIHDGPALDSPVWASVERVTTDLSLWGLLRGSVVPRKVTLERPSVTFRLDRAGRFLNLPALRGGGESAPRVPAIEAKGVEVAFRREGRPEAMVVSGVHARLSPDASGHVLTLSGASDDPAWGPWTASGTIEAAAHRGKVELSGRRVEADPARLARVPFVPADVWTHVVPRGPVDVRVDLAWGQPSSPGFTTRTEVTFLETSAEFPTLGFGTKSTTGRLRVDGGVVRLDQVEGRAIGGRVDAGGTLDFVRTPPRVDLDLHLHKVNVADTPRAWKLDEAGITGLLTGEVHLRAILDPGGVDLSGSSGEAYVENAQLQGIPVKSLRLAMHARGKELQYDTKAPGEARLRPALRLLVASLPLFRWSGAGHSRLGLSALAAEDLVALQAPAPPVEAAPKKKPEGGIRLPSSITTHLELEDVDVKTLVAKAQFLSGFPFPLPITGKLTLKAQATIPLGELRNIEMYAFHGDVTIKGASVYQVDFSSVAARLDLADGVLELTKLRGMLVDHPDGGPDNPPAPAPAAPSAAVAEQGALPAGGFRGRLRAELAPLGDLSGRFEGGEMPLGELAGPFLPRPTPVAGLASLTVETRGDLRRARDPEAWTVSGEARSVHIAYKGAGLDEVAFKFAVEEGRLAVPSLTARLGGRPLKADATVGLKPPSAFHATVDVAGWDLAAVAALVPSAPDPLPAAGQVSAQAQARGTLSPFSIVTSGQGRLDQLRTGPVDLGDVPFRWTTDAGAVVVSGVDAHPFGGEVKAEARVPTVAGKPTEGSARIAGIDTAQITAAMPKGGLKLTGKADGSASFVIPAHGKTVEASVTLSAPDLTVQSIPAEKVRASLRAVDGALKYELTAESLGGRIKFEGDLPLSEAHPRAVPPGTANGEVRIAGFTLGHLWKALGITGAASRLSGEGAIDANVREILAGADKGLWAHGIIELRDLAWNAHPHLAIGHVRGIAVKSPKVWRLDPLRGELLGGPASGLIWGTTPAQGPGRVGFNLRIERAALRRLLSFVPVLGRSVEGFGTLLLTGTIDDSLRADVQFLVGQARVAGVPLNSLRVPAELVVSPATGSGTLNVRRWSARLAGGTVRGDAAFRLGADRSFQAQLQVAGLDLLTLSRLDPESSRPSSGRISGRINLSGPNPALPQRYRGRVTLELDDASLFSVPVFREIDKFLGAARGGLFEDGDLVGTIANRQLNVEMLTLEGRLVQLHATGTVGFDRQVNLEVLVNTNQIIPETGQALVGLIPGLREVIGRSDQAISRVGTYLSNRLLKLRVTGTLQNPTVAIDSSIPVAETAVSFFAGVLKLPLGFIR